MGWTDAEGTGVTRTGSSFYLQSYDNSGGVPINELTINRSTHQATFAGPVHATQFNGTTTTTVVSAASGGQIYFRPNGPASTTEQSYIDTNGDFRLGNDLYVGSIAPNSYGTYAGAGLRNRTGSTGSYNLSYWFNANWNGTTLTLYANATPLGQVAWACDHRIKKDVKPLDSTWDKVKALNPIRYTQRAYEVWTEDDTPRWGFVAHELQEHLFEGASSGVKDGADIQSPNLMAIIAGLTRALQEAMARIEALEAAA